jgi:hypothetical protein
MDRALSTPRNTKARQGGYGSGSQGSFNWEDRSGKRRSDERDRASSSRKYQRNDATDAPECRVQGTEQQRYRQSQANRAAQHKHVRGEEELLENPRSSEAQRCVYYIVGGGNGFVEAACAITLHPDTCTSVPCPEKDCIGRIVRLEDAQSIVVQNTPASKVIMVVSRAYVLSQRVGTEDEVRMLPLSYVITAYFARRHRYVLRLYTA